ncbi:MAG: HEPN domain-containing protein [Candidatus Heimdallarchaeota archaeon]
MDRPKDWLKQAEFDLSTTKTLKDNKKFSWAYFIAHQAAEKALKALLEKKNLPSWGHDLVDLVERVKQIISVPQIVVEACSQLNLYYIPTRYPDTFPSGAPANKFIEQQAIRAIEDAEEVLTFVQSSL